ncbi:hypothetical protein K6L44_15560 [Gluconacetobacter entanii]|uniref:hypothetical protein n=1 Tax=Gluconacetobacter entanii TaxID=108528 RepID=UPI00142D1F88|nr:hypothetical protein [Gluconacetobacter entanii]MCE2579237.1 hypothetical protein [Komagataeibacter sp. FNDCR1]MBY4641374.1 hypothetical protein [Gluconacetobacter entanii]MCW4580586.1 hypothetical protein [Gluconacetobacter entanii]MCW4583907.1 hypothetical protein [Gluconacetobacter entanii]MCW4587252.1 hypothetical protein [Gluconacetobacter entanii]
MSPGFFYANRPKVFGEAFFKKLRKTPPFSIKRRHPKTFIMFIGGFLKQSPKVIVAA